FQSEYCVARRTPTFQRAHRSAAEPLPDHARHDLALRVPIRKEPTHGQGHDGRLRGKQDREDFLDVYSHSLRDLRERLRNLIPENLDDPLLVRGQGGVKEWLSWGLTGVAAALLAPRPRSLLDQMSDIPRVVIARPRRVPAPGHADRFRQTGRQSANGLHD